MNLKREDNYDWLRIISMIAVIMIHVSGTWINSFSQYVSDGGKANELLHPIIACVYNSISRFAVPCFIMLTGAFVLDDNRTSNYKMFYQKKLSKIGVPTLIFSCLYIAYRVLLCIVGKRTGVGEVVTIVNDVIKGSPFYHMWYLFMLIGIYLLAPIVVRFKDSISYEMFRRIAFIFLVMASFSQWTTGNVKLNWNVGQSFEYLGYFMVGYVLRKDLRKNNIKAFFMILLGFFIEIVTAMVQFHFQIVKGIAESDLKYEIVSPYCPSIVIASLLIFAGFSMLTVKCNNWMRKLAGMSFVIYLFHAGVYDFIGKILYILKGKDYLLDCNNVYWIPILIVTVFVISVLLTIVYAKIMDSLICHIKKK
mgnify:CR=1 FL=1